MHHIKAEGNENWKYLVWDLGKRGNNRAVCLTMANWTKLLALGGVVGGVRPGELKRTVIILLVSMLTDLPGFAPFPRGLRQV